MDLTDNEKREVLRFLEEGKPLPDKYRFLLFGDKREVELVWNGKTNEVTQTVLPFQVIEQVDEPRAEKDVKLQQSLFDYDSRGRQIQGWTNKLIWGDNKLILSSLKNGPLREEIEKNGGIKLIYIDPPFDVGADFSMDIEIGDEQFTKQPTVLEELAYRDTWGKGADSFIAMIYERLSLMKSLLTADGSIFVHCDWRVNSYIRLILDEIFGEKNFRNEITWVRSTNPKGSQHKSNRLDIFTDTILFYAISDSTTLNLDKVRRKLSKEELLEKYYRKDEKGRYYDGPIVSASSMGPRPTLVYEYRGYTPPASGWRLTKDNLIKLDEAGDLGWTNNNKPFRKLRIENDEGNPIGNMWSDISLINSQAEERIDYPTQKPEKLIARIIEAASNKGDIVADFFVGSGTMSAVAEKLGRKWIVTDLGKFSIHTTRKRMINVQRELKAQGNDYRAFEILNLGKYERQYYVGINDDLRDDQKQQQLAQKEKEFVELILRAYKAEAIEGFRTFVGKKMNRLISVGPINLPVTRLFVEEIVKEALEKQISKVDILAFEFEMGLFPHVQEEAKSKGVDLVLKYIPRDVFDKRAIEKNQIVFNDVSYIEVKPLIKGKSIAIELTDFSVYYNQDSIANAEESLKNGGNKLVVENGQIIKVSKDKDGIVTRDVITKKWTDWIDYWAIDFDFESKKEIIRITDTEATQPRLDGSEDPKQMQLSEFKEVWTGDYIFENEWQSFRTKKNRTLELTSVYHECPPGRRKIAVKVVDIFGNDTMKVIEVNI